MNGFNIQHPPPPPMQEPGGLKRGQCIDLPNLVLKFLFGRMRAIRIEI